MKISDLQKFLAATKRKHGDVELLETRFSDYKLMEPEDWSVVEAIPGATPEDWIMKTHHSMAEGQKARAKSYLHYAGN